jgi:hypothetical protein
MMVFTVDEEKALMTAFRARKVALEPTPYLLGHTGTGAKLFLELTFSCKG